MIGTVYIFKIQNSNRNDDYNLMGNEKHKMLAVNVKRELSSNVVAEMREENTTIELNSIID